MFWWSKRIKTAFTLTSQSNDSFLYNRLISTLKMFCPECGSILRPKDKGGKKVLYCSCGYTKTPNKDDTSTELKELGKATRKIEVVENIDTRPKIKIRCEKCSNNVAYYWTQQTRGADEPETRFFKCTKCNYTWREYA